MIFDVWFENTNVEETAETKALLEELGAMHLVVKPALEAGHPTGHNQFTCELAVDCHNDILDVLKLMLYYNDYTAEQTQQVLMMTNLAMKSVTQ
jgi:hypothetical protein